MNILLIVAHPKKESFSFAMAERILKQAYEKKHNIDIIDLYRDKNQQPFFHLIMPTMFLLLRK
nr:hypothetical protein BACY1_26260 [Tenacibaculum mesophilum]